MYKGKLGNTKEDLKQFREITEKFYAKEISVKDYKGFSGFFGSYAQRGGESSMLRLRLSSGQISKDKLKFIVEEIRRHKVDRCHFTTCQTIQLHDLKPQTVCDIMEAAIDHDIITLGGGGDFPRNVMCSPLSGVEQGEYFDVMPYANLTADYLLSVLREAKLPRKLKVGFANSPANSSHVTFRDLGFLANGEGTFDVYSAGGLGPNPKMGVLVEEKADPTKVLYYVKAMVKTFTEHGNYENRAKARTRYMQDKLGTEGYREAYRENLKQVMAEGGLDVPALLAGVTKTGQTAAEGSVVAEAVKTGRVIQQKQTGLYGVSYHPAGGTPTVERLGEIYEAIENMDQVELRLTPDQTMYIINCDAAEAQLLLKVTEDGAQNVFETSVCCIGGTTCQTGLRDTQGLMKRLIAEGRAHQFADGVLPRIHISGCTSSCGTHQVGIIGFHGGAKTVDGVACPAFTLHIYGRDEAGKERFGEILGSILEDDIPAFLMEVGNAVQAEHTVFDQWAETNGDKLKKIAEAYLK